LPSSKVEFVGQAQRHIKPVVKTEHKPVLLRVTSTVVCFSC
jgi:hypothetical protein